MKHSVAASPALAKLIVTEEQELIRGSGKELFARHPLARVRALRAATPAFSRPLWAEMAGLGWLGMTVPEAHGGAGLGVSELAVVLEQAGRALAPEPLIGATLAVEALALGGDDGQRARWLPRLVTGEALGALAWDERAARGEPAAVAAVAEPAGDGFTLRGDKRDVLAGADADVLIVAARRPGEPEADLWLVDPRAPGVSVARATRVDHQPCAHVALGGVAVAAADRLGGGPGLLARVIDRATIGLAAEMLGAMSAAFEMTLAYLRDRKQFGVAIGTFQALRHRAARLYVEIELVRSTVMAAARTADLPGVPAVALAQAASLAKARAADAAVAVANDALQLHGGIGMTEEHDVGLFFKRARVAAATFGDAGRHRDRWARLAGY